MILVAAVVLAVFVLSPPWSYAAVGAAAAVELLEVVVFVRWSQRRRVQMGAETLVGEHALVVEDCRPHGKVRIHGELWRARADSDARVGERVRVRAIEELTLLVSRDA